MSDPLIIAMSLPNTCFALNPEDLDTSFLDLDPINLDISFFLEGLDLQDENSKLIEGLAIVEDNSAISTVSQTSPPLQPTPKPLPKASKVLRSLIVEEFNKQLPVVEPESDGSYKCETDLPVDKSYQLSDPKDLPPADPAFMSLCAADKRQFKPALALMNPTVIKIICDDLRKTNSDLAETHTFTIAVEGNKAKLLVREKLEAVGGGHPRAETSEDINFRKKHPIPTNEDIQAAMNDPKIIPHKEGLARSKVWTIAGNFSQCTRYFKSKGLKIVKTSDQPKDTRLVRIRVFFEDKPKPNTSTSEEDDNTSTKVGGGGAVKRGGSSKSR